ncbi:hypothetical protein AWZ03_003059 [Drosophila navojoa]|uniref:Uncharacterized protein n=1 Tax=Drosophila navojoa TaxID=7232 RepID=A0A484BQY6_DRONA|nr:uncharacterized protein LOC108652085 [Drosophila navojoa]TDG50470.1 hypothetical protein AWZ03_003059 [Drosophila navojoa]
MRRRQFDKCVKNAVGVKRVRMESKCVSPVKREANNSPKVQQMQQPNRKQQEQPQSVRHAASPKSKKELIVHWTRWERQNYDPIRLLPPW